MQSNFNRTLVNQGNETRQNMIVNHYYNSNFNFKKLYILNLKLKNLEIVGIDNYFPFIKISLNKELITVR